MTENKRMSFKMYGLQPHEDHKISPGVLGKKLILLEKALKQTDKLINGEAGNEYTIEDFKRGSLEVVIEEKSLLPLMKPSNSGIEYLHSYVTAISTNKVDTITKNEKPIVNLIRQLTSGIGKSFSHAEFFVDGNHQKTILVDKQFQENTTKTVRVLDNSFLYFKGIAYENYDGHLKEVDLRKPVPQAKLILFAASVELDLVCKSIPIDKLREALNKPVSVIVKSTYNGLKPLPIKMELVHIKIFKKPKKLSEFQGKLEIKTPDPEDIW